MQKQMDPKLQKCIDDCSKCYQTCTETLRHCLEMGGSHVEAKHLTLLMDCAKICKISEDFMLRGSEHDKHICAECAHICEQCADSCEKIDPNDNQMMQCAKMCRQCAVSCKEMAA